MDGSPPPPKIDPGSATRIKYKIDFEYIRCKLDLEIFLYSFVIYHQRMYKADFDFYV